MSAAMRKLNESDLLSLERYSRERPEFRARVMAHKKNRQIAVGPQHHVAVRGPAHRAVPGAGDVAHRAHFRSRGHRRGARRLQPADPRRTQLEGDLADRVCRILKMRRVQLGRLRGVEDRCWVQAAGCERLYAIADEDLERENEVKTSAVHFLRFELSEP